MVARVEKLGEMSSIMADGGEGQSGPPFPFYFQQPDESDAGYAGGVKGVSLMLALGQVLRNWPHIFSVLSLFGGLITPPSA